LLIKDSTFLERLISEHFVIIPGVTLKYSFFIISGIFLFIFNELFVSDAYAYLDPSSGTMAIQAILGVLVGAGIAIKIYWEKIKFRLSNKFMKPKDKN
tara:strand:+ start:148 stop:441 length:294 start_codon:yes stop_codon:yes gene_type:complete